MVNRSTGARRKEIRRYVTCALIGIFVTLFFGTMGWLDYEFVVNRPNSPQPDYGFIYPVKANGIHFVSAIEAAGNQLAFFCAWLSIFFAIIVVPKDFSRTPSAPWWRSYNGFKTGLEKFEVRYLAAFMLALLGSAALVVLVGAEITQFALNHDLVRI
jgi:hypothetical protein